VNLIRHQSSPWTPERLVLVRRDWLGDVVPSEILVKLNALPGPLVSLTCLRNRVAKENLKRSVRYVRPDGISHERREDIMRRSLAGETHASIARSYGVSGGAISKVTAAGGIPARLGCGIAPSEISSQWPQVDVDRLKELKALGFSHSEIAREMKRTVCQVWGKVRKLQIPMAAKPATPKPVRRKMAATRQVPAIMSDGSNGADVARSVNECPATPSGPPPRDLTWAEIAAIAKQIGCWRPTQDFLLVDVNARLIARGERPVRIRKWAQGAIPPRVPAMDAYA